MKIILAATDSALADAWQKYCGEITGVSIHRGSIFDLSCDAAVTPIDNSFGFMTSGISFQFNAQLGSKIQDRLQAIIQSHHHGELVVGTAEIIPTDHSRIPFLIAAPTARTPGLLVGTVNAYLAARAVLLLLRQGRFSSGKFEGRPVASIVESVALPGLGTGGARIGANSCARQVRAALDEVLFGKHRFPQSMADVIERERLLAVD